MVEVPQPLVTALGNREVVLWAGVGFGALAGRPGWPALLERLKDACPQEVQGELAALLEQGRLRTVLSYVHRHLGDEPLTALLTEVSQERDAQKLPDGCEALVDIPWSACLATTYADVLWRLFADVKRSVDVIDHTDVHKLSLRTAREPFILRTPPRGRSMRADGALYDFVEELVHARTLVFLGFEIDDPDFIEILELLGRIGRARAHYVFLPFATTAETEELLEQYGLVVVPLAAETSLCEVVHDLARSVPALAADGEVNASFRDLAALDLDRALRGLSVRADLALDTALTLSAARLLELLADVGDLGRLRPSALLRLGGAMLAHGRSALARRCFQQLVVRGAGREYQETARFNLGLVALEEGDRQAAAASFVQCSESDRSLALLPPRFELLEVTSREGTRLRCLARDRESHNILEISVTVVERPMSDTAVMHFYSEVERLVALADQGLVRVFGGFADGQLFGVMTEAVVGPTLYEYLRVHGRLDPATTVQLMDPILGVLSRCHAEGIVHRNLNPLQIIVGERGCKLNGFGFEMLMNYQRPSVRRLNRTYAGPELLKDGAPSPASDVHAMAAVVYECLTGVPPLGSAVPASRLVAVDPRIDALLGLALHPESSRRPSMEFFRAELNRIVSSVGVGVGEPLQVVPAAFEGLGQPSPHEGVRLASQSNAALPDVDDLEGWAWVLERKPTHVEARRAVRALEDRARAAERWDTVADALLVRAQHAQIQSEREAILWEAAEVFESRLEAPGSAFEVLTGLLRDVEVSDHLRVATRMRMLAASCGRWSELVELELDLVKRTNDDRVAAELLTDVGRIELERLGDLERAAQVLSQAVTRLPTSLEAWTTLVVVLGRLAQPRHQAHALLELAKLQEGDSRIQSLRDAALLFHDTVNEPEQAMAALTLLRENDALDDALLELTELVAARLRQWPAVADALEERARRCGIAGDEMTACELWDRAAGVALGELDDRDRAIADAWNAARSSVANPAMVEHLVEALRGAVASDPRRREELHDALVLMADRCVTPEQRAAVLDETACLLDADPEGRDRAAECRRRLIGLLSPYHEHMQQAFAWLEQHYRVRDAWRSLADMYQQWLEQDLLERPDRIAVHDKRFELFVGPLDDIDAAVAELRVLVRLEPGEPRWQDELLRLCLASGEYAQVEPIVATMLPEVADPQRRATLLLSSARAMRAQGDVAGACERLELVVALRRASPEVWLELREVYREHRQPLKALDAAIEALRYIEAGREQTALLREAAAECLEVDPERAVDLLERLVVADPDDRTATTRLLELLVRRGDLRRAWPAAKTLLRQVRAHDDVDPSSRVRALLLAARCAIAVDENKISEDFLTELAGGEPLPLDDAFAALELSSLARSGALVVEFLAAVLEREDVTLTQKIELCLEHAGIERGHGELNAAATFAEQALTLDPDNELAADLLWEIASQSGDLDAGMRAVRRMIELAYRKEARAADSPEAADWHARRVGLLQELSRLQERAGMSADAERTLEHALELDPGNLQVLTHMLERFTTALRFTDAAHILERLAHHEPDPSRSAEYCYQHAVLLRDHLGDPDSAIREFRNVLALDPRHEEAFVEVTELLTRSGDWRELTRVLREWLKSLPSEGNARERAALLQWLGEVYESELDEPMTAMAAYEQSLAILPHDPEVADLINDRRRRVMNLAIEFGGDELDKALEAAHALVIARPLDFELQHMLVTLYLERRQVERAAAVAATLRFLQQANVSELALAARLDGPPALLRTSLSREQWRKFVVHPLVDPHLSELFAAIWPMVTALEPCTHAAMGVDRGQRLEVTMNASELLPRFMAQACQVLDSPAPDLLPRLHHASELVVAALAEMQDGEVKTMYPSVLAGQNALVKQPETMILFRAARSIALARPEHLLSSTFSAAGLTQCVWGALRATRLDTRAADATAPEAIAYAQVIQRFLPVARLEQLRGLAGRAVDAVETNIPRWQRGVVFTANRVGMLLSGSLDAAAVILTQEGADNGDPPTKDLVRDLVDFSVSEPYLRLRSMLLGA